MAWDALGTMTYALTLCFLSLSLLYFKIYRWRTRISIADIPGPKPESFILGTSYDLVAKTNRMIKCTLLGNLRQYFQSQAGQVVPHFSAPCST